MNLHRNWADAVKPDAKMDLLTNLNLIHLKIVKG
jgi:hypothetical protein